MAQPVDTSTSHLGFRCVLRAPEPNALALLSVTGIG